MNTPPVYWAPKSNCIEEVSHWHKYRCLIKVDKRKLDMGVEVNDNRVKKEQRHPTNQKPNMYVNIFN